MAHLSTFVPTFYLSFWEIDAYSRWWQQVGCGSASGELTIAMNYLGYCSCWTSCSVMDDVTYYHTFTHNHPTGRRVGESDEWVTAVLSACCWSDRKHISSWPKYTDLQTLITESQTAICYDRHMINIPYIHGEVPHRHPPQQPGY